MADLSTVIVPDLPGVTTVTGDEQVVVYSGDRLKRIPQSSLRGTKVFSGPTAPPEAPSLLAAIQPKLGDRWRNETTGDEWKVTSLDPFVWTPSGNVKGAPGDTTVVPGPPGQPGRDGTPAVVNGKQGPSITLTGSDIALSGTEPTPVRDSIVSKASANNPALTGAGTLLEGLTNSPSSSHGGLTVQNTSTTAAAVLGPQQPPSYFTHDGVRSTIRTLPDATAQTTSAFGFYAISYSAKDTTGLFGTSVAAVDNTTVWGLNPTVIDAPQNGQVTTGLGRKLVGIEINPSVTSRDTIVQGIAILGSSISQPKYAVGMTIGDLYAANPGVNKWSIAYAVQDASSMVALSVGAMALSGSNVAGIPSLYNYRDSAGAIRALSFGTTSSGSFAFGGPTQTNGMLIAPGIAGQSPTLRAYGGDANVELTLRGQGSGEVVAQSRVNAQQGLYVAFSAQFATPPQMPSYTVGTLPTPGTVGRTAYCINARVLTAGGTQQASGAGSGGLVTDDGAAWRVAGTNLQAQA